MYLKLLFLLGLILLIVSLTSTEMRINPGAEVEISNLNQYGIGLFSAGIVLMSLIVLKKMYKFFKKESGGSRRSRPMLRKRFGKKSKSFRKFLGPI